MVSTTTRYLYFHGLRCPLQQESLRDLVSTWAPYLDKHMPKKCRILLAGNKADCCGPQGIEEREVSQKEAKVSALPATRPEHFDAYHGKE